MPEPVPDPTPAQIVTVAEITLLDVDTVTSMIAADGDQDIVNAKWARTLADITTWNDEAIANETGDIKRVGSMEFFENKAVDGRLDFRNKIRTRYGQPLLVTESGAALTEVSSLKWF